MFDEALDRGVHFSGVKPYFDLLGRDGFEAAMPDFIPEPLLEFMNPGASDSHAAHFAFRYGGGQEPGLSPRGDGAFPEIRIVLAHMGRYVEPRQLHAFCDSGLLDLAHRITL